MLKKLFFSGTVCLILSIHGYSQPGVPDTLTILSYNTLNYGFAADGSQPTLNTQSKHTWLRTILNYAHPDILGLVKMDASLSTFTTDTIVHKILDSVCAGCYHHALFTNYSGYTKENMLYFRDDKIGFLGTTTIYSGDPNISDINLHSLYYKTPDLSLTHDTIFLNIILVHIKSGSGNDNQRGAEINGVMNWLNSHITHPGNYFIMGDFNTQSSSEICYQSMVNSSNPDTKFNDPVNMPGDWANNPTFYANYLTQSSRVADLGDGGATGGLGLRFDQILCTQPVIDGSQRVKYIPNSYIVIGQDGLHTNVGLIDAPTNNSVPAPVLNALYYMSNHLPVSVKVSVDTSHSTSIAIPKQKTEIKYNSIVKDYLQIQTDGFEKTEINIIDENAKILLNTFLSNSYSNVVNLKSLAPGIYFLRVTTANGLYFSGKIIRINH